MEVVMATVSHNHADGSSFVFPIDSFIGGINFEGLSLHTFDIMKAGIGYQASASQILAHGMKAIGSRSLVCNLPFCFSGYSYVKGIVSSRGEDVYKTDFQKFFEEKIKEGFSHFNLPLDFDGHASLMHGTLKEGGAMEIVFFDSLLCSDKEYKARYDALIEELIDLIPVNASGYKVHHVLDQGDEASSGCGYYTLQTAYLLTQKTPEQLLSDFEEKGTYLYTSEDDTRIRCELAVRAILFDGIDSVDIEQIRRAHHATTVFHKLSSGSISKTIKFIEKQQRP